jgi:UDP-N-acetylglucosamine 1-carboxyvinyltransferase
MAEFGALARAAREAKGWSQADLASRVGLSPVQISRIESGKRGMSDKVVARIVRALDLDPQASLDAIDPPKRGAA